MNSKINHNKMAFLLPVVFVLFVSLFLAGCSSPPKEVARAESVESMVDESSADLPSSNLVIKSIDKSVSAFIFTGYGPGKSHTGTFDILSGNFTYSHGLLVSAGGIIDATSVKSDSTRLDTHLKNKDFFDVTNYPTIVMKSTSISENTLVGELTFHGVTQTLEFPVNITQNSIAADVIISMKQFGIVYAGVNDEVRIQFNLVTTE